MSWQKLNQPDPAILNEISEEQVTSWLAAKLEQFAGETWRVGFAIPQWQNSPQPSVFHAAKAFLIYVPALVGRDMFPSSEQLQEELRDFEEKLRLVRNDFIDQQLALLTRRLDGDPDKATCIAVEREKADLRKLKQFRAA